MDEREWVARILAGDEAAYRDFYLAHRDRIYQACVYLLGYQDPDAEDLTQEAFLVALRRLPQFQFRSSLYYWLNHIAMFLCYERIRSRGRFLASENKDLEALAGPHDMRRQEQALADKKRRRLLEAVESQRPLLGEPCRKLLDLREKESKSYAAMADILEVPIGTVMSRLARCRKTLKELVEKALKGGSDG